MRIQHVWQVIKYVNEVNNTNKKVKRINDLPVERLGAEIIQFLL